MSNELNRELILNCWQGNLEQVEILLKKGANINFRWDVHTFNSEDIVPEYIVICQGGILEEVKEIGNVDPITREMYPGDRVCPMDIALGRSNRFTVENPNLLLLKILLKYGGIDFDEFSKTYEFKSDLKSDFEIIESVKIQIMHEEISKELENQNNKDKPKRKNKI